MLTDSIRVAKVSSSYICFVLLKFPIWAITVVFCWSPFWLCGNIHPIFTLLLALFCWVHTLKWTIDFSSSSLFYSAQQLVTNVVYLMCGTAVMMMHADDAMRAVRIMKLGKKIAWQWSVGWDIFHTVHSHLIYLYIKPEQTVLHSWHCSCHSLHTGARPPVLCNAWG